MPAMNLTDSEFSALCSFVQVNFGLDLHSQRVFADTRLTSLIERYGFSDYASFYNYVLNDSTGNASSDLVSSLTVSYSLFYREPAHFDYLRQKVLPELEQKYRSEHDLRIWSAGCATGEEPYTIAMVLNDYFGWKKARWDTTVLATDISTTALRKAIVGSYNATSTQNLDEGWRRHYFTADPEDDQCIRVNDFLRKEVLFREHNLVSSPFFFKKKFHFIFCRNVMLYFSDAHRDKLIKRLYDVIEDGGYLFIGLSETINRDLVPFEYVMPSVFRKGSANR